MSAKLHILYPVIIVFLLFSCISQPGIQTRLPNEYRSKEAGIATVYPEDWTLYTSKEETDDLFKALLEKKETETDSPLFVGINQSGQAGTICVYEAYSASVLDYFELQKAFFGENLVLYSAKYIKNLETIECHFELKDGEKVFSYLQTMIKQEDRVLKVSSYSNPILFAKYKEEFLKIHHGVEFYNKEKRKWEQIWLNLPNEHPQEELSLTVKRQPETTENRKDYKYFFWGIQGKNNMVYCLGSIHVGKPEFYPLSENIETAFAESENLAGEIYLTTEETLELAEEMMTRGSLPPGETLENIISEENYIAIKEYFSESGLPFEYVQNLKPWVIATTIDMLEIQKLGYDEEYGVDRYFQKRAEGNKNIISLETVDEQMAFFEEIDGNAYLSLTLHEMENNARETEDLIRAWQEGDIIYMESTMFDGFKDFDFGIDMKEKIYTERNIKMAEKIKDMLKEEEDYFVIVGAAHFLGEEGIISLLGNEGYIIERM